MAPLPRLKFTFTGALLPPTPPHSPAVQKLEAAGGRSLPSERPGSHPVLWWNGLPWPGCMLSRRKPCIWGFLEVSLSSHKDQRRPLAFEPG